MLLEDLMTSHLPWHHSLLLSRLQVINHHLWFQTLVYQVMIILRNSHTSMEVATWLNEAASWMKLKLLIFHVWISLSYCSFAFAAKAWYFLRFPAGHFAQRTASSVMTAVTFGATPLAVSIKKKKRQKKESHGQNVTKTKI